MILIVMLAAGVGLVAVFQWIERGAESFNEDTTHGQYRRK